MSIPAEKPREIPGDLAHCMGCGEKWKVGDEIIAVTQAPMVVSRIYMDDGIPMITPEEIVTKQRAWHACCLR